MPWVVGWADVGCGLSGVSSKFGRISCNCNISIEKCANCDCCKENVMQSIVISLIKSYPRVSIIKVGNESSSDEYQSLEQVKLNHEYDHLLPKRHTMAKHQSVDSLKVWNRIVTELCCLIAFFAHNTHTNGGRLYHVYIITTITDGQSELISISFHKFYNLSLFVRRRSVYNDGG